MKMIQKFLAVALVAVIGTSITTSYAYAQSPTGTLREKVKEKVQNVKAQLAHLVGVKVDSISGTTLTVSKDGKTYTINTDASTKFRRLFWGKSSLSEISVGDNLNVWGKWTDDAQTTILARMIRDTSIMKRFGVFIGTVKSKDTASFVITTVNRGDQTVSFDNNTKFVNRKGATISYNDVNVGDRVKVRGLWDKTLSKITQVTQVKDFSLPPKPTGATQ